MFTTFLEQLFDNGRVIVGQYIESVTDEERPLARNVLRVAETIRALEFPGRGLLWDESSGLWAAEIFYSACQLAVHRDVDLQSMTSILSTPCPACHSASSTHYSVDLVFRYLPDLYALAREASHEDPLLTSLERLASEWPLSSVGMKRISVPAVDPIINDGGLLRYYAERIIARRDTTRLSDRRVVEAIRSQIGLHVGLAPEMIEACSSLTNEIVPHRGDGTLAG